MMDSEDFPKQQQQQQLLLLRQQQLQHHQYHQHHQHHQQYHQQHHQQHHQQQLQQHYQEQPCYQHSLLNNSNNMLSLPERTQDFSHNLQPSPHFQLNEWIPSFTPRENQIELDQVPNMSSIAPLEFNTLEQQLSDPVYQTVTQLDSSAISGLWAGGEITSSSSTEETFYTLPSFPTNENIERTLHTGQGIPLIPPLPLNQPWHLNNMDPQDYQTYPTLVQTAPSLFFAPQSILQFKGMLQEASMMLELGGRSIYGSEGDIYTIPAMTTSAPLMDPYLSSPMDSDRHHTKPSSNRAETTSSASSISQQRNISSTRRPPPPSIPGGGCFSVTLPPTNVRGKKSQANTPNSGSLIEFSLSTLEPVSTQNKKIATMDRGSPSTSSLSDIHTSDHTMVNMSTSSPASPSSSDTPLQPTPQIPLNSFMMYKKDVFSRYQALFKMNRASGSAISTAISQAWKNETEEVKKRFQYLAELERVQYQSNTPLEYKYQKRKPSNSSKKTKSRAKSSVGHGRKGQNKSPRNIEMSKPTKEDGTMPLSTSSSSSDICHISPSIFSSDIGRDGSIDLPLNQMKFGLEKEQDQDQEREQEDEQEEL